VTPGELPPLGTALALVLLGLPFLVLALRWASRRLPARPRAPFRWTSGEAAAIVALPFALVVAISVWLRPDGARPPPEPDPLVGIVGTQLVLGSAAALAYALARRRPHGRESLGLGPPWPAGAFRTIVAVFVGGSLFYLGAANTWLHAARALGWEEQQEVQRLILSLEGPELAFASVLAVLVGPFVEELLFRGFLQGFMAQVVGERWALLCASALFARLHGLAGLPLLFLLSLFLGWLQLRTRCLLVPWSAHALNNGVTLALGLALGERMEALR
jgi:membrane protease YdiL (CAAX protease family)